MKYTKKVQMVAYSYAHIGVGDVVQVRIDGL